MITRNINTPDGLVNGATGPLKHVTRDKISKNITILWLKFDESNIERET